MRISDWSSDVCSSDLSGAPTGSTTWSAGWRPAAGDRAHEHPTMSVIASRLDTRSDAFRANAERTSGLVEELRAKVRAVKEGGGERARERHRSETRRVGTAWVSTCRSWGSPKH